MTDSISSKTLHVAASHPLGALTAEEAFLLEKLNLSALPKHVAVIMDGNGRWAQRRHLPRIAGHRKGTETARVAIETCSRLKVEALTLYAFSVENWRRPKAEIDFLMQLLREYIRQEMPLLQKNNIRMRFLGRANELPAAVQRDSREAMEATAGNTGMVLCVALNYGGRAEIVDAATALLAERRAAGNAAALTEADIEKHLYTAGLPDPDLLIRTSGELRVSNFLLWQIAYAELFVTDTLWPDFNRARLLEAFLDFQKRDRRFGGIGESEESDRRTSRQSGK
ncbi:MAG TPA: isoprenyl transferase [Candidatus Acidoferrum sp.]